MAERADSAGADTAGPERSAVPACRRRTLGGEREPGDGDWVLYWMTAFRRPRWNWALQRAVELASALGRPLVVLEALRCGHRFASDRLHRFVVEGMADNARAFAAARQRGAPVLYHPWLERREGEGEGLFEALAERACVVVGDDCPTYFLPRMLAAAAQRTAVRFEVVDSNGLLPMRATDRVFARAHDFRRFLQRELPDHLGELGAEDPLAAFGNGGVDGDLALPEEIAERWPAEEARRLDEDPGELVSECDVDHSISPVAERGGCRRGSELISRFLEERLARYVDDRRNLDDRAASELSFHLHFGHTSVQEVFVRLAEHEDWTPESISSAKADGKREGWWGMSTPAESFLDELVTWREVGFNMAWQVEGHDRYDTLPEWARQTLADHADDPRPEVYERRQLEAAETDDEIWNAAQRELLRDGRIHNYLRMLWGKKILEWSPSPEVALDRMLYLNDRHAVDGRDPNSVSGICWCLGRYDRAWGPEREIYGKVRYMSSANTRRKLDLSGYLEEYGERAQT